MKPIIRGTAAQLVAGVLLGVVAGVLGIHFGFLSAVLALVVVILFGFAIGRSRGASAGLVGLGGTWFVLMLNALMAVLRLRRIAAVEIAKSQSLG